MSGHKLLVTKCRRFTGGEGPVGDGRDVDGAGGGVVDVTSTSRVK